MAPGAAAEHDNLLEGDPAAALQSLCGVKGHEAEALLAAASGDLQLCVARLYKQRAGGLAAARPELELESDAVSVMMLAPVCAGRSLANPKRVVARIHRRSRAPTRPAALCPSRRRCR